MFQCLLFRGLYILNPYLSMFDKKNHLLCLSNKVDKKQRFLGVIIAYITNLEKKNTSSLKSTELRFSRMQILPYIGYLTFLHKMMLYYIKEILKLKNQVTIRLIVSFFS